MQVSITYDTDNELSGELETERSYYNSWDGELFTVVDITEGIEPENDTVTVCYHGDSSVELVHPSEIEVDFERIHPVEAVEIEAA